MKVENLMQTNVVCVDAGDVLSKVFGIMERYRYHQLPVTSNNTLVGLIAVNNLIKKDIGFNKTKVESLVSRTPVVEKGTDVKEVANIMLVNGLRALPVIDENSDVVGIISETDLIESVKDNPRLEDIMSECIVITEDDTVAKAREIMKENNISRLPVVDENGALTGIVDSLTIIRSLRGKERKTQRTPTETLPSLNIKIKALMNKPATATKENRLKRVIKLLEENDHVIVVEQGGPVGIITPKDVVELLVKEKEPETLVRVIGIKDEGTAMRLKIDQEAKHFLNKFKRIFKTVDFLFLHIERHNPEGKRTHYTVRTRFKTPAGMGVSRADGWDLVTVVQDALNKLGRVIKSKHEKVVQTHKGKL